MFAHPLVNVLLALMWCLLSERFDIGTFAAGFIISALVEHLFRRMKNDEADFFHKALRPRKVGTLLKLMAFFAYELLLANIQVAILILRPRLRVQPALIRLPIELQHDLAITALANMISLTPGTITVDVAEDRKSLVVHCLNVPDIEETKRVIKERFEAPLRELES